MHGIGFELPLQEWFDFKVPKTTIKPDYIHNCLQTQNNFSIKPTAKIIWLGHTPKVSYQTKTKKGQSMELLHMIFHKNTDSLQISVEKYQGLWLLKTLDSLLPKNNNQKTIAELKADFEKQFENFELFWFSKPLQTLKDSGLLILL